MDEQFLLKRITVNPNIFGGKPIIRGRRLAVEHVLGMLAAGDTPDTILHGRGGPMCLDRMFSSLSGASQWSAYAAVCRVGRLSKYTPSGVCPSSVRCGLVWL